MIVFGSSRLVDVGIRFVFGLLPFVVFLSVKQFSTCFLTERISDGAEGILLESVLEGMA